MNISQNDQSPLKEKVKLCHFVNVLKPLDNNDWNRNLISSTAQQLYCFNASKPNVAKLPCFQNNIKYLSPSKRSKGPKCCFSQLFAFSHSVETDDIKNAEFNNSFIGTSCHFLAEMICHLWLRYFHLLWVWRRYFTIIRKLENLVLFFQMFSILDVDPAPVFMIT